MDQPHQTSSTQRGRPRQRSAVACTWCHSRRVKCNAAAKGTPCSNCEAAGRHCMLIESKRGKKRKVSASPSAAQQRDLSSIPQASPTSETNQPAAPGNVYDPLKGVRTQPKNLQENRRPRTASTSTCVPDKPDLGAQDSQETLYAQVLDKATDTGTATGMLPDVKEGVVHVMYMGETFNLTHLLRQTNPDSARSTRKRHYVVRFNPKNRTVSPVEKEEEEEEDNVLTTFLQHQGCFTLPSVHTCYQLFQTYFEYVHPHYPILDREDFAAQYTDLKTPASYLLLQSVLFMASGHCELSVLLDAGFESRYHARRTFFQRAKALYDNDHEPNKVTVVQAVFLISFWWNGPTDQKDTWHWLGIAISLALTLGMHRSTQHSDMKPKDRCLWKKIWWSLFAEDKHAATALGRPVHIRRRDCDVEPLEITDFDEPPVARSDIFGSPERVDGLYVIALVELSMIAESIIESSFTAFNATTSDNTDMFQSCSQALEQWRSGLPLELRIQYTGTCLWTSMLHIAHSWFEIVTHRSIAPQNLSPPSMKTAHFLAMDAANRMVRIVEELLSQSHILHCPIHIVPALFAAMGMQAVDICSGQSILEQLGVVKVRLAMIALRELQSTWPVSGWIFRLFAKIVRRIRNGDVELLLPHESVNASSPVQKVKSCSSTSSHREPLATNNEGACGSPATAPAPSQAIDPRPQPSSLVNGGKSQYGGQQQQQQQQQDPSLTPMYTMPSQQAAKYLFPEASNLAMPLSYPADWGTILDDGAWADLEYEF
ncbi:hypothetical protein AYL99_02993 [Fonsecaea erecta]|uniref:Zn(2)-C6 fungal-type domain-containing protein n=1 Tax=Fonsecaea erecta TaxID=1367422 RepID=A0A178ZWI2_9EURO|nr:hypothetical protein AYL99_02993 [Fonsecaea erecta]OAP63766.1 hypothetical protein AYL99_02993 [Fonsecaea erecta]